MPIYEFKCQQCGAVSNHLARSFTTELHPVCPRCEGTEMQRLISRPGLVGMRRGSDSGGPGDAGGSVAGYARQLRDGGGHLTPEMRDALDHLATEAGGGGSGGGQLWGSGGEGAD